MLREADGVLIRDIGHLSTDVQRRAIAYDRWTFYLSKAIRTTVAVANLDVAGDPPVEAFTRLDRTGQLWVAVRMTPDGSLQVCSDAAQGQAAIPTPVKTGCESEPSRTRIDPDLLQELFALRWLPFPLAPVEGQVRVPPGCDATIGPGGSVGVARSARALGAPASGLLGGLSGSDRVKAVTEAIQSDLGALLVAGGERPVFAFSGGVDSAVLAAIAKTLGFTPVLLTVGDESGLADETARAADLANHLGLKHESVRVSAETLRAGLTATVRAAGFPFSHPSPIAGFALGLTARRWEQDSVVFGDGADRIFGFHGGEALQLVGRAGCAPMKRASDLRHAIGWPPALTRWPTPASDAALLSAADDWAAIWVASRRDDAYPRALRAVGIEMILPELLRRKRAGLEAAGTHALNPFLGRNVRAVVDQIPIQQGGLDADKSVLRAVARRLLGLNGVAIQRKRGLSLNVDPLLAEHGKIEFLSDGFLAGCGLLPRQLQWARPPLMLWTAEIWARMLEGWTDEAVDAALWVRAG